MTHGGFAEVFSAIIEYPLNLLFLHLLLIYVYRKILYTHISNKYNTFRKYLFCFGTYLIVLRIYLTIQLPCDHSEYLTSIFWKTVDLLQDVDLTFVPCWGTLLGIYRDNRLIPFEYDSDFCMTEEMCARLHENKDAIEKSGAALYKNYEILPWYVGLRDFPDLGWTLKKPCARIYYKTSFVDIYPFLARNLAQLQHPLHHMSDFDARQNNDLISSAKKLNVGEDHDLFCSAEICWLKESIFPFVKYEFMGREIEFIADPTAFVEQAYGADWKTPHVKGVKTLTCGRFSYLFYPFGLLLIALAFTLPRISVFLSVFFNHNIAPEAPEVVSLKVLHQR